jgi:ribosome-binding factor A
MEINVLASAAVNDVRDVININSADVPDAKITKMLKRAEVTLELELGKKSTIKTAPTLRKRS